MKPQHDSGPLGLTPILQAPTILVADDDAAARTIMRAALRKAGYEVRLACGGADALQQFRAHPTDMVMLDIDMPDMGGHEVCATLRREAGALLPIVMVTGMDDVASVETAYQHGATDFIAKPVNWALIGHRIRYLFRGHQALLALRDAEARVARLAYYDSLTGLPNRHSFLERVDREITRAGRNGHRLGVLFMDLDGFKNINDTLGHAAGDLILQWAAERLREGMRAGDLLTHAGDDSSNDELARLGGDEFTAVILDIENPRDALMVANRVAQSMRRPFVLEERQLTITTSIGIAIYPEDGTDAATLLKHADTAMYHAKTSGRDNAQLYNVSLTQDIEHRMEMDTALRQAVEQEQFALVYQPQVDSVMGRVVAVEALIRWTHPVRGALSPMDFIPLSEEIGLIEQIGEWVLRTACKAAAGWRAAGQPLRLAVNLSPVQLRCPQFADRVMAILAESGLPPSELELEVTEGVLMEHSPTSRGMLQRLRDHGVQIALDDFGTGYSSLSYLMRMPIGHIKIDRSFVAGLLEGGEHAAIVRAVLAMAGSLGLRCTAEGVESLEQASALKSMGCHWLQGYYFSKPVALEQVPALTELHWSM
jgi:diguanylate cyclase (GGDEF)-like protein